MQYSSQCATRRRCPSRMRPALLRACTRSFWTRAPSSLAPCLAAADERYLEWRSPHTFTCHQPARSTTWILIFIAAFLSVRRGVGRCVRGPRSKLTPSDDDREMVQGRPPIVPLAAAPSAPTAGIGFPYKLVADGFFGYLVNSFDVSLVPPVETPEPIALPLFATGLGAMAVLGWRRKRKNAVVGA